MTTFPEAILDHIRANTDWDAPTALKHLGGPLKPLICYYLQEGVATFRNIRNLMPECDKLSLHFALEELQSSGILRKAGTIGMPPTPRYCFTDLGLQMRRVYEPLWQWSLANRGGV